MTPFSYAAPLAPAEYKCSDCGASQCKLWRRYNTVVDAQVLRCAPCAAKDQGLQIEDMDHNGRSTNDGHKSDALGWLVPAIPTEDGETYWGYTSVPGAGVRWWHALRTKPGQQAGGWIRRADRLPEDYNPVQFCVKGKTATLVGRRDTSDQCGPRPWEDTLSADVVGECDTYSDEQVTHWAPLLASPPAETP